MNWQLDHFWKMLDPSGVRRNLSIKRWTCVFWREAYLSWIHGDGESNLKTVCSVDFYSRTLFKKRYKTQIVSQNPPDKRNTFLKNMPSSKNKSSRLSERISSLPVNPVDNGAELATGSSLLSLQPSVQSRPSFSSEGADWDSHILTI